MPNPVIVLGIGNLIFSDDAAGLEAVRRARAAWQGGGVDFAETVAAGLEFLDMLTGYRSALVVDAAATGQAAPGDCFLVDLASLPALADGGAHGAHLGTALEIAARMSIPMPARIQALAIEIEDGSLGERMTPAVQAGVERAVPEILRLARELLEEVGPDA
jgi:hydrogenase maturation protease